MSSLTPDNPKRRDIRRKRKSQPDGVAGVESEEEEVGEDHQQSLQPRVSLHSKRSPKVPKASGPPCFEINGEFTFKGNLTFGPERPDSHRRATLAQSTRGPTRASQPSKTKRSATHRDAPTDPQTESGEESSSYSDESSSSAVPRTRATQSMIQPSREPQRSSYSRSKRYQPDEGYHTGRSASYTGKANRQSDNRRLPSPGGNSTRHARLSSSVKSRRPRAAEREISEVNSEADQIEGSEVSTENEAVRGEDEDNKEVEQDDDDDNDDEDDDESEDDFGKLRIQISGADSQNTTNQALDANAILDTGTKPNWISQIFYQELRKIGIKSVKLTPDEQKREYRDFNNKKFSPESKVKLMIQSDEFQGKVKCRLLTFFISRNATFTILIGIDTIRHQELMTRRKRDTDGEGVLVGQHGEVSEAEKAETKRKRDERNRIAEERKKKRQEKREETMKEKGNDKTTSSNQGAAAHLATLVTRGGRPQLPPRGANSEVAKVSKKPSESSLEGTW